MTKADEDLWLDTISCIQRTHAKLLQLEMSQRSADFLNHICKQLESKENFLESLRTWKTRPDLRAEYEKLVRE